jgi:hypothetical protein
MMRKMLILSFLVLLPIGCLPQQEDQSKWDKYQPRTLQSIIDVHQKYLEELDIFLSAESFPSRVKLVYLGKSRPLEGKHYELLKDWNKMIGIKDDLVSVFGTEMLFREGKKEYWIAVQKPLLDPLPKEVVVGKQFTAYIVWMGAIKDGDHWEWLFAMNEFDTPTESSTP